MNLPVAQGNCNQSVLHSASANEVAGERSAMPVAVPERAKTVLVGGVEQTA